MAESTAWETRWAESVDEESWAARGDWMLSLAAGVCEYGSRLHQDIVEALCDIAWSRLEGSWRSPDARPLDCIDVASAWAHGQSRAAAEARASVSACDEVWCSDLEAEEMLAIAILTATAVNSPGEAHMDIVGPGHAEIVRAKIPWHELGPALARARMENL